MRKRHGISLLLLSAAIACSTASDELVRDAGAILRDAGEALSDAGHALADAGAADAQVPEDEVLTLPCDVEVQAAGGFVQLFAEARVLRI